MYLFKSREDALLSRGFAPHGNFPATVMQISRTLYAALTGEERPAAMLGLLGLLVLLLHAWALIWLLRPVEPLIAAQPLIMEVSLLAAPPASPSVKKTPSPKKAKPKPKKQPPLVPKTPELPRPDTAANEKPVAQPVSESVSKAAAPPLAVTSSVKAPASDVEKFTEANYRAKYGFNPKPEYPRIARSRGWEGKVLLKVQVSADGVSEQVSVQHSSGHDSLDEAAVAAVEKWRFIPAKRGGTPVASSVIVPIIFRLD
jgi:protein TonB